MWVFSGSHGRGTIKEKWTKISRVDEKDTSRHAWNSFDFPFTGPKRTSGTSGRRCIKDSSDIGNRSKLLFLDPTPLRIYRRPRFHDFLPTSTCSFHPSTPTPTPNDHDSLSFSLSRTFFSLFFPVVSLLKLLSRMTAHGSRFRSAQSTWNKYERNKFSTDDSGKIEIQIYTIQIYHTRWNIFQFGRESCAKRRKWFALYGICNSNFI